MNKSLYELTADMQMLENGLNQETNEETYKYIDSFQMEINAKLEGITCIIKNNDSLSTALAEEIKTLTARKKALDKQTDRLKEYVSDCMQAIYMKEFESPKGRISFRASTSVNITDADLVPNEFKTEVTETTIDKNALKKYLKELLLDGEIIDGAELVKKQNLQIK